MSALASVSEDQLFQTLHDSLADPKGQGVLFSAPPGGLRSKPTGVVPEVEVAPELTDALRKDPATGLQQVQAEAKTTRGAKLAAAILEQYYRPLHAVLCKPATTEGVSKNAAITAQITALSHFLQNSLGLDPITAFAAAAIIATVVIRLFQGAFCALSETVVLPRLKALAGGPAA